MEEAIRGDIIVGVLEPGLRLRGSDLQRRYGVSATPLREALQRLAEQKLIEWDPRMGVTVAPISKAEVEDTYEQRELLEGIAIERAILHGGDEWRRGLTRTYLALEALADDGNPRAWSEASSTDAQLRWSVRHRAFHDALLEGCDSPWLLRFVRILSDHSERYRMVIRQRTRRNSLDEHQEIYLRAISGDANAAKEALRRHLVATVDVLEGTLQTEASNDGQGASGDKVGAGSSTPD